MKCYKYSGKHLIKQKQNLNITLQKVLYAKTDRNMQWRNINQ